MCVPRNEPRSCVFLCMDMCMQVWCLLLLEASTLLEMELKGGCKLSYVDAASWTRQKLELTASAKTMHCSLNSPLFSLSSPSLLFKQDYSKDGIHYYLKLTLNCFLLVFRDLRVCYRTQIPDLLWCRWAISVQGCSWKERSEFKSTLTAEVWRSLEDSAQKTG